MIRSQLEFVAKCKQLCADIDEGGKYWASAELSACGRRINVWAMPINSDEFSFEYLLDLPKPNLENQARVIEKLEALL